MKPVEFRLECTFKGYEQAHEFIKLIMQYDEDECRAIPTEFHIEGGYGEQGRGAVVTVASSWGDNIKAMGKLIKKTEGKD